MLFYYNSSASGGKAGDIAREKNISELTITGKISIIILKKYVIKCDFQWEILLLISNWSLTGPGIAVY